MLFECFCHVLLQVKRLNTFKELRHSIQTLWKELETVPSTLIGKEMAKEDAETTFKLSSQNMEALRDLNQEVSSWTCFLWQWRPSVRTFSNCWILQIKEGVIRPRWITPSEICRILHILQRLNSKRYYSFEIIPIKTSWNMVTLTGRCLSPYRRCIFIRSFKGDRGLFRSAKLISSKLQMLSVELSSGCSCHVFRQYTVFRHETSKINVLPLLTSKTTQTCPQVFLVNGSIICNFAALLMSSVQYGKILPNLVNSSWLWWIMPVILANQKWRDILNK